MYAFCIKSLKINPIVRANMDTRIWDFDLTKNMKYALHVSKNDLSMFLIQLKQNELNKTCFARIGQIFLGRGKILTRAVN
jgi:hypothetical protein